MFLVKRQRIIRSWFDTIGMHDFSAIISQLKTQHNPLEAEQFLDEERLRRIYHCEGPDPFSLDAILGTLEKQGFTTVGETERRI